MWWAPYLFNAVLASVPDLAIAWAYANYMHGGWPEFWTAIIALQALYLALWLKSAGWAWFLFVIFNRRRMAKPIEQFFRDNRFPPPEMWVGDLDDYLQQVVDGDDVDADTKITAAFERGTLNGLKTGLRYSLALMTNLAGKLALNRYARYAAARPQPTLEEQGFQ